MKIVRATEMRAIDRLTSERFGVPSLTLMENAGASVADFAQSRFSSRGVYGIICGKGNNGGDGFVVARKLHESGRKVQVLLLADPAELRGDAARNFEKLPVKPVIAKTGEELNSDAARRVFESQVLIDAILGTGFRPPILGHYAGAIEKINASTVPVLAVDIPSGADADVMGSQTGAVARADAIVTFTAPRPAHVFGDLTSGPIVVAAIGSPEEAVRSSLNLNLITAKDIASLLAPRPRNSNKGMYGHVLVLGGSLGKAGAAAMAGFSALRAGAGLVTVATAKSVLPTVAGFHPELMTESLEDTDAGTIAFAAKSSFDILAKNKSVLAIGPGISRHPETSELVQAIVRDSTTPIVLDADGLNAFEARAKDLSRKIRPGAKDATLVLTPHPGEMSRLTGLSTSAIQRDRIGVAQNFAQELGVILVLKGDRTIVAGPEGETWVNPTGNPGMATGGTGDILTGIISGILSQHPNPALPAVIAAVFLHGLAGDIACYGRTPGPGLGEECLVATDLIRYMPHAFWQARLISAMPTVSFGGQGTKLPLQADTA
ncbi:MAG TPA: NAD(P)H-hydrate dehydratase [Terriglobales bacterium]|jgi:NAD(P)H-hydrate epimerase|nr:NAD(P)H-hydrate dehydratase [Terriglobales bacterium]